MSVKATKPTRTRELTIAGLVVLLGQPSVLGR